MAAVDYCSCGTFQVHLGAFTLRLDAQALASLAETLERAVAARASPRLALVEPNGRLRFARASAGRSRKS